MGSGSGGRIPALLAGVPPTLVPNDGDDDVVVVVFAVVDSGVHGGGGRVLGVVRGEWRWWGGGLTWLSLSLFSFPSPPHFPLFLSSFPLHFLSLLFLLLGYPRAWCKTVVGLLLIMAVRGISQSRGGGRM